MYDFTRIDPELLKAPAQRIAESNYASVFHKKIIKMINDFERDLNPEEEVGVRLVSFGQTFNFILKI